MHLKKIVVIGSTNTDMVIKTDHLPVPGETILGGKFLMNPGGKGANQAVAASRLGGKTTFISKTGNDIFGRQAIQNFENEGVNTEYMLTDPDNPSGVALITVDKSAENCIVVAPGSNMTLTEADIDAALPEIEQAEIVLMQLEIPIETVEHAAKIANDKGIKVVLNPAPAAKLPDSLLANLYMITPNETEAELLTGIKVNDEKTAQKASENFMQKGVKTVIITMGSKGVYISSKEFTGIVPAPKVEAVDTTAAGDTFNGALCVGIADGFPLEKAARFANKAASIAVTRLGAQSSTPFWKEIKEF